MAKKLKSYRDLLTPYELKLERDGEILATMQIEALDEHDAGLEWMALHAMARISLFDESAITTVTRA